MLLTTRQRLAVLTGVIGAVTTLGVAANPLGARIVHGDVGFANPDPQTLQITNSPNAVIDWGSFSIRADETTRFIQESATSAVLNRVTGNQPSNILGSLLSNGRVFLVNSAGIIIGRDGMVDTAGLVMSTLDINNADFMNGELRFTGDGDSGAIVNRGYIKSAPNGNVILLAPSITNAADPDNSLSGVIDTPGGQLVLAAGRAISISSLDDPAISFEVQAPEDEVVNLGSLLAQGGIAKVYAGTIRQSGVINADAVTRDAQGRVVLFASHKLETGADSVISASGGDGIAAGEIEIVARATPLDDDTAAPAQTHATIDGTVVASGQTGGTVTIESDVLQVAGAVAADGVGDAGTVNLLASELTLSGANVSASAEIGQAGAVHVGGDYQGQGDMRAASLTTIDGGTRLQADAATDGDGGEVIVWSELHTDFYGYASARGGVDGGDGGLVEVSGKQTLGFHGSVEVGAPGGLPGTLLLDPRNIRIIQGDAVAELVDPDAFAGDRFSASGLSVLPNGNLLVVNQMADATGLVDAGEIFLFDPLGNLIGSLEGTADNEMLGSAGFVTLNDGNRLYRSPNATANGIAQAGAVIGFDINTGTEFTRIEGTSANEQFGAAFPTFVGNLFAFRSANADVAGNVDAGSVVFVSRDSGMELNRISGGSANEFFGNTIDTFGVPVGTMLIRSPSADVGGLVDAGTAVLVDSATAMEIGRVSGQSAGDMLGQTAANLRNSGNFLLAVPNADPGGIMDAGSVVLVDGTTGTRIGAIDGTSANEGLGNIIDTFALGFNEFLIRSPLNDNAGGVDAGTVILASDVDLGGGNIELGRSDGISAGEQFGLSAPTVLANNNFVIASLNADAFGVTGSGRVALLSGADASLIGETTGNSPNEAFGSMPIAVRGSGNYFIFSPFNDGAAGMTTDAGAVVLASGTTGMEIGRFSGDTVNQQFGGSGVDLFSLGFNDILVSDPDHNSGGGIIAQLSDVDLGGSTIIRNGGVIGAPGSGVGSSSTEFLPSRNYVVATPGALGGMGTVEVYDDATGNLIVSVSGNAAGEMLGSILDFTTLGFSDTFAVISPTNGGNNQGAIFFVDGSDGGGVLNTRTGAIANDMLGSEGLLALPTTGNFLIPVPLATVASLGNAGSILTVDNTGALIGQASGTSAGELFGTNIDLSTLPGNDFLVLSELRDIGGGPADVGAVVRVSGVSGLEQGVVTGTTANEQLGTGGLQTLTNGNFVIFSPNAGGGNGSVILADGTSAGGVGVNMELGRVDGATPAEFLGTNRLVVEAPNGNYFIPSRNANNGGAPSAGTLYLADGGHTGGGSNLIGQVDGNSANESLGDSVSYFALPNGDSLLISAFHSPSGLAYAGTVIHVAAQDLGGGNIIRNRIDGTSANERLGLFGFQQLTNSDRYIIRSPDADPGGIVDAGSLIFVDRSTGNTTGRLDGTSANERIGFAALTERTNGNVFVRSTQADVGGATDAGSIILVNSNGGLEGRLDGNNSSEFLGSIFDLFSVPGTPLVRAPLHNANGQTAAGAIFALSDTNLGGGNIVQWSVLGTSADENLGSFGPLVQPEGLLIQSPDADPGGRVDAGLVAFIDPATGAEIWRAEGDSAGDRFGQSFFIDNDSLVFVTPDADPNGLMDAGEIRQITRASGGEVQRLVGISADERLGGFGSVALPDGRRVFFSPDADVNGIVDAGRMVFFDATGGTGSTVATNDVLFADTPGNDLILTTGSIANALSDGGTLILQANNDITIDPSVNLVTPGSLVLQAGHSINNFGRLAVDNLTLVANESVANGVLSMYTDGGPGVIEIDAAQQTGMPADTLSLFSDEVFPLFLEDPAGFAIPASFLLGIDSLNASAEQVRILANDSPNGFAALVSHGEFTVVTELLELVPGNGENADAVLLGLGGAGDIQFTDCVGCEDLLFDPFSELEAQSGTFISGLFIEPTTDAILSMLNKDDEEEEDDEAPADYGMCN